MMELEIVMRKTMKDAERKLKRQARPRLTISFGNTPGNMPEARGCCRRKLQLLCVLGKSLPPKSTAMTMFHHPNNIAGVSCHPS
jgi:hypothetical protein